MTRGRKMMLIAPAAVAGMILFIALGGWIVQSLWNWLLPMLFGWRVLTFWQAVGLLALCRILFGGFGMGRGGRSRRCRHMSEEEREQFREMLRRKAAGEAT